MQKKNFEHWKLFRILFFLSSLFLFDFSFALKLCCLIVCKQISQAIEPFESIRLCLFIWIGKAFFPFLFQSLLFFLRTSIVSTLWVFWEKGRLHWWLRWRQQDNIQTRRRRRWQIIFKKKNERRTKYTRVYEKRNTQQR